MRSWVPGYPYGYPGIPGYPGTRVPETLRRVHPGVRFGSKNTTIHGLAKIGGPERSKRQRFAKPQPEGFAYKTRAAQTARTKVDPHERNSMTDAVEMFSLKVKTVDGVDIPMELPRSAKVADVAAKVSALCESLWFASTRAHPPCHYETLQVSFETFRVSVIHVSKEL
eukprot:1727543-Rhodomonas_salina.1